VQKSADEIGLYAGADWKLADGFTVTPGLRVDYYSQTGEGVVDARATGKLVIAKDQPGVQSLAIKGAAGQYHQPPSLLQTSAQIGNTSLDSQDSIQVLGGLEYKPTSELTVELDAFHSALENVIVRSTQVVNRMPQVFNNDGSCETSGVEVFVQQRLWKGLEGWLYYTFSVSDLSTTGGNDSVLSPYDQTHVLGAVVSYALPGHWRVRTRFQYASGFPTTAVIGSVYDSSGNAYVPVQGPALGARTPEFSQLDVRIDKAFVLGVVKLTAYLDVRNVYNRANVVSPFTYNYDYSQSYAQTGVPILPMIGLRAEF
jgi:outer membrane receptor protein involved in Fe transport